MFNTAIAITAALAVAALAGCAQDAPSRPETMGLKAFIDRVAVVCAPLHVGSMVITPNFQPPNYDSTAQYGTWVDQVSRLYDQRIEPAVFAQNIKRMFPGERTTKANQCLVDNLPPPSERSS